MGEAVPPLDFSPPAVEAMLREFGAEKLRDPWWRITSGVIYKIMTKDEPDQPGSVIPFIPNDEQVEFLTSLWHRNVVLKARQLGFCLDGQTLTLTADLRWVPIADLREGDELVAVDEHPPGGRGAARKMRTATVQATTTVQREAFRITLDDGREVICTDQHPWLTKTAIKQPRWRSLSGKGNAVVGRVKIGTSIRWITKPWATGDMDDGWMGGMLDGEGSMAKACASGAEINVSQRDGAVWRRLCAYAEGRGYTARIEDDATERLTKHGTTPVPKLCFSRMDEVFRLIGQTRPTRFIGKRFWEGKELPGKRNGGVGWAEVVAIEPLGLRDMIDLQTSTGTYIAEGLVSHNTTATAIYFLDHALYNPNQRCGIIAHRDTDAQAIFRDKVLFAYENMPVTIRENMPLARKAAEELLFAHNNSSIRVSTSMRSGTIHRLHISELGKMAAQFPARAEEVMSGSLPAVPQHGVVIAESTAEGAEGVFFDMCRKAEALAQAQTPLTNLDFRFHFFAWWRHNGYRMDPALVRMSVKDHEYFDQVEGEMGCALSLSQRAWYVATRDGTFSGDQERMWREHPSTPAECWQRSTKGTWFHRELAAARGAGRIGRLPIVKNVPVDTFWDIGASDGTAIWFMQEVHPEYRFINFIEGWGEGYSHFIKQMDEMGYLWGTHYLPHDAEQERQGEHKVYSPASILREMRPGWRFRIVPRVDELIHGIQALRDAFPTMWFDEIGCKEGLEHLALYKKRFVTQTGTFADEPVKHDGHSEAADALRQFAQALEERGAKVRAGDRPNRRKPKRI